MGREPRGQNFGTPHVCMADSIAAGRRRSTEQQQHMLGFARIHEGDAQSEIRQGLPTMASRP